jgi:hypothetical protein
MSPNMFHSLRWVMNSDGSSLGTTNGRSSRSTSPYDRRLSSSRQSSPGSVTSRQYSRQPTATPVRYNDQRPSGHQYADRGPRTQQQNSPVRGDQQLPWPQQAAASSFYNTTYNNRSWNSRPSPTRMSGNCTYCVGADIIKSANRIVQQQMYNVITAHASVI